MEVMEIDGEIIALDQEKAYDEIRHRYLWNMMKAMNLPAHFVRTVMALYNNTHTQVAINRVVSKPFWVVTRGVRQGDPLSCLLFNLAIEPLACKLRNCDNLRGLSIPGVENKLIVNLFADHTTGYLSSHNRFDTVECGGRQCSSTIPGCMDRKQHKGLDTMGSIPGQNHEKT